MLEKVEKFCLLNNLIDTGDCFLIACSGGPDSIALADIFRRLSIKYKFKIHIAHAEHGIRQVSSLNDAEYVKNYCEKYTLSFHLKHLNVLDFCKNHKLSVETAARQLRYDFLRNTAKKIGAKKIVTAHHLNDQAETVLQHLMRGAGMDGLSGMKVVNGDIIRPFLCLYRNEIEFYCKEHNLNPCIDESNMSLDYERNKIRLELLPQMSHYNKNVVSAICRSAAIVAEENDFFQTYVKNIYDSLCSLKDNELVVNIDLLKSQHLAVRKSLYRLIIKNILGNLSDISFKHIDKIDSFVYNGHTGSVLQLPYGIRILYSYCSLKFFKEGNLKSLDEYNIKVDIKNDDSIELPNGNIIEIKRLNKENRNFFETNCKGYNFCFIDSDKLSGKIYIRTRQNGDRIVPKGMKGSKKLKDIFIDRKIPADKRSDIPLLCDNKGIIWIAGVQQSADYLPDKSSKNILYLNFKK